MIFLIKLSLHMLSAMWKAAELLLRVSRWKNKLKHRFDRKKECTEPMKKSCLIAVVAVLAQLRWVSCAFARFRYVIHLIPYRRAEKCKMMTKYTKLDASPRCVEDQEFAEETRTIAASNDEIYNGSEFITGTPAGPTACCSSRQLHLNIQMESTSCRSTKQNFFISQNFCAHLSTKCLEMFSRYNFSARGKLRYSDAKHLSFYIQTGKPSWHSINLKDLTLPHGERGGMRRKKVCVFCGKDNVIDYKDTNKLKNTFRERVEFFPENYQSNCAKTSEEETPDCCNQREHVIWHLCHVAGKSSDI